MLLLRQGLWNRQEDCSACFPLNEQEWEEIHSLARKQTVQGIVYDGVCLLPAAILGGFNFASGCVLRKIVPERLQLPHTVSRNHLLSFCGDQTA